MYAIKFKEKEKKSWWFLKPNGEGTRLKIHAGQMTKEKAEQHCQTLSSQNLELDFKIVNF
jgi:hypothetical protein